MFKAYPDALGADAKLPAYEMPAYAFSSAPPLKASSRALNPVKVQRQLDEHAKLLQGIYNEYVNTAYRMNPGKTNLLETQADPYFEKNYILSTPRPVLPFVPEMSTVNLLTGR